MFSSADSAGANGRKNARDSNQQHTNLKKTNCCGCLGANGQRGCAQQRSTVDWRARDYLSLFSLGYIKWATTSKRSSRSDKVVSLFLFFNSKSSSSSWDVGSQSFLTGTRPLCCSNTATLRLYSWEQKQKTKQPVCLHPIRLSHLSPAVDTGIFFLFIE